MVRRRTKNGTPSARQRRILISLIVIVLIATFGSMATRIVYEQWRVVDQDTIPYQYRVVDTPNIGFALGTGDLAFGKVMRGGGGGRTVQFATQVPLLATFAIDDPYITAIPNPVYLNTQEQTTVSFNLNIPMDAAVGNFTGEIRVTYLRPLPWE